MATYQDKNEWVDNVYTVDVFTPVLGGKTAWQGEHPVSGYSNASIEQLADRTHYLKEAIETLERVVGVKTDGVMLGKNNLSELTDIMEAKYRLELNLVDNVRDLDKPVSNPTRVELNKKADKATKILGNDGLVGGGDLSTNRNVGLSQATKDSLLLADNSVQKETRVIAGNGLTGGGYLSGDVTINLGTPSETSVTSTNSSSGASHSHALSAGVKDSLKKADEAAPLTFVNTELGKKVDKEAGKGLSTNDYTTAEKTKLSGIATGATKNATDAQLRDRTTHTGEQPISSVTGLQTVLDGKVEDNDPRMTNSREWTATVVSQVEAETGTATTARKWTAQRVRQAINAWWTTIGGVFGKTLLNSSDANAAKSSLGLHSVASSGNYNELSNRPASMTQTEANAGSSTTARLITPKVLVDTVSAAVSGGVSADALIKANNLSDVPNKQVARNNLELGTAAIADLGTGAGSAARGNHTHNNYWDIVTPTGYAPSGSLDDFVAGQGGYTRLPSNVNAPATGLDVITKQQYGTTDRMQIALPQRSVEEMYMRTSESGTWRDWLRFWHSGNFNPSSKQDKLTAGSNISISGNTISATNTTYTTGTLAQLQAGTDTSGRLQTAKLLNDWLNGKGYVTTDTKYSAGSGLTLSGTTFSLPVTVSGSGSYVQSIAQNANGITVTLGTPPNTNTTYSAGGGLTLSGTAFSLPVTVSGSGSYVQSVTQNTNGLTVTLGTPPNTTYSAMSVAEIRAGTATTSRVMTAKDIDDFSSFVALSGTAITPNRNSGRNFSLSLTGNTTINNPTNLRSGQTGDIAITVGATEHTLSFGSAWKFSGGNVPETKANSITVISYKVVDASTIICGVGTEVK